jgi:hypothetical protein
LGSAQLLGAAKAMTVLVVGDSHARALGVGMANVSPNRLNLIINDAMGGCGIMESTQYKLSFSGLIDTPSACSTWPDRWAEDVTKYHPQAVFLTTSNWDYNPQMIDNSGKLMTLADEPFRKKFDANMDRAINIFSASGAKVFLENSVPNPLMSGVMAAVAARHPGNTVLLDLQSQFCNGQVCPPVIDGITVNDESGHPFGESQNRLGRWLLNQIANTLHAAS